MPSPSLEQQISALGNLASQPVVPQNWMAQTGAILGGFGAGLGMGNPVLEYFQKQRDTQLKHQLDLIRVQQAAQGLREQKEQHRQTLLMQIAKELPDDQPELVSKKLELYNQLGVTRFTPEDVTTQTTAARGKQMSRMLPQVIGAIKASIPDAELETYVPGASKMFNLPRLRAMTDDALLALAGPDTSKKFSDAMSARLKSITDLTKADRQQRIEQGRATPMDFALEGATTPEEIGARLMTQLQTVAPGHPPATVPPEYKPFLEAYARAKRLEGLKGPALMAMEASLGDAQAAAGLKLYREATRPTKYIGDFQRKYMNRDGDEAPPDISTDDARAMGYFPVTPKEETITIGVPTAMAMVNNIFATVKQIRDAGGFRSTGGLPGLYERGSIAYQRSLGDPQGLGGLYSLLDGQKGQLISILRALNEKGNIAMRLAAPQIESIRPENGIFPVVKMLQYLQNELMADIRLSRIPGFEKRMTHLPYFVMPGSDEYKQAVARGVGQGKSLQQVIGDIEANGTMFVVIQ